MADDRPAEDPVEAIARISRELEDLRTTTAARLIRRPVGDIEAVLLSSPKTDTLLLQGQTVNRADYPGLWQWVESKGLSPSVFGAGNGTTTFVLPDFRGRVIRGSNATDGVGITVGADSIVLTAAQMPQHTHTLNTVANHQHARGGGNRFTNTIPDHGAHVSSANVNHPTGTGYMHGHTPSWGAGEGSHNHTVDPGDAAGGHTHSVGNAGTGTAFDNRQASIGVNWLIWT
jgi:microcystin-dependent protein